MKQLAQKFWKDEQGIELSEYAVMAGLIIVVAVGVILTLGGKISDIFETLSGKLDDVQAAGT